MLTILDEISVSIHCKVHMYRHTVGTIFERAKSCYKWHMYCTALEYHLCTADWLKSVSCYLLRNCIVQYRSTFFTILQSSISMHPLFHAHLSTFGHLTISLYLLSRWRQRSVHDALHCIQPDDFRSYCSLYSPLTVRLKSVKFSQLQLHIYTVYIYLGLLYMRYSCLQFFNQWEKHQSMKKGRSVRNWIAFL